MKTDPNDQAIPSVPCSASPESVSVTRSRLKTLAKISVLGVLATILMLFEIPLPFAPSFYEIDLSEAVVLIGGFAMGPMAAVAIELLKILLNLILNSTITMGVGEAANFLIGCSFILPATVLYRRHKTMKTAVLGMTVGTLCMAAIGGILNAFVLLPTYVWAMGLPSIQTLIDMGAAVNPLITSLPAFILWAVVPFNLLKGVVTALITVVLYKRVSPILHR